ncbi:MAG: cytochrome c [Planctomycetes bacterium]|nr:cytochrome c [Planctomycetota bacterium]
MPYRKIAVLFLALGFAFAAAGMVAGQAKDEKPAEKKEPEKPLTKAEFDDLMEKEVKDAWNKLKINDKKKMGEKAAEAADVIAAAAAKVLRYDGKVLKGENKDKLAREQKDFKDWVDAMKKHAEEYAKHARKGDWTKAAASREKINETCGACHDVYEPPKEK